MNGTHALRRDKKQVPRQIDRFAGVLRFRTNGRRGERSVLWLLLHDCVGISVLGGRISIVCPLISFGKLDVLVGLVAVGD